MNDNTLNSDNSLSISMVSIDGLFGRYSYDINEPLGVLDASKVLILYGENGTGKTTILKLIYHILNPEKQHGHRTYIARQLFRKFHVELSNGFAITAERTDRLVGDYKLTATDRTSTIEIILKVDENNSIPGKLSDEIEAKYSQMMDMLNRLDIHLFFLPDDRKLLSGLSITDESYDLELSDRESQFLQREVYQHRIRRSIPQRETLPLEDSVSNLVSWIRDHVYSGSTLGETNASTIYSDVIKHIAESQSTRATITTQSIDKLLSDINDLSLINNEYTSLGLIPNLNMAQIADIIQKTKTKSTKNILYDVIKPYTDGIKARFEALSGIKNIINTFLRNINDFYIDKTVSFDLSKGIRIFTDKEQELTPALLSSGEKQLMLLFCHTIVASEQSSILIIDEPEISLNVTWQRKLIRALLECGSKTHFQLLLATHSMELLTQYSNNVIELLNKDDH